MKMDEIDQEIIRIVGASSRPVNPSPRIQKQFAISRQAVTKRLRKIVGLNLLTAIGTGRGTKYVLGESKFEDGSRVWHMPVSEVRSKGEDRVYNEILRPEISGANKNSDAILNHICTEMLNNVLDHSYGHWATITLFRKKESIELSIADDGMGLFASLRKGFSLENLNEAITELLKGRRTTQSEKHAGEGIFFSMRMADHFQIEANGILFEYVSKIDDFTYRRSEWQGTRITFSIEIQTETKIEDIFRKYTDENYQFVRNRVFMVKPYVLKASGVGSRLVSRSEAKRFIAGAGEARSIIIDFRDVENVGQGFADEVFRVWATAHPDVEIGYSNANDFVIMMIRRCQPAANVSHIQIASLHNS